MLDDVRTGSQLGFRFHAGDFGFLAGAIFVSFGLFAPRTATVITALFVAGLSLIDPEKAKEKRDMGLLTTVPRGIVLDDHLLG
jgi:hypothetical protein